MSENGGNDSGKSRQDLLNELEELRSKLTKRDSSEQVETGEPTFARPITRRTALTKWVAPAVLSIPLTALVRSDARAQGATEVTATTTPQAPTDTQTRTQTATPEPTNTPRPTTTPAPTRREPTRMPTKSAPQVPGLGIGAAAVLGGGLAVGVAKIASDRAKANREAADDDGSKGEE